MFELGEIRGIWGLDKNFAQEGCGVDGLKSKSPTFAANSAAKMGHPLLVLLACPRFRRFPSKAKLEPQSALRKTGENAEKIGARRFRMATYVKADGAGVSVSTRPIVVLRD
jgi:hypothetical protein